MFWTLLIGIFGDLHTAEMLSSGKQLLGEVECCSCSLCCVVKYGVEPCCSKPPAGKCRGGWSEPLAKLGVRSFGWFAVAADLLELLALLAASKFTAVFFCCSL
ncbi:hypothetical protein Nepgr_030912 [Nepenthes gracilis]|uniref:Secreted protein n=1 Tax=Nepenthes gracilis TaxID=150966 RepID=A0AAD3Y6I7_NEPGR|nr:hypothetical protein Nepgr_030912 [Nepenthes gracilis]